MLALAHDNFLKKIKKSCLLRLNGVGARVNSGDCFNGFSTDSFLLAYPFDMDTSSPASILQGPSQEQLELMLANPAYDSNLENLTFSITIPEGVEPPTNKAEGKVFTLAISDSIGQPDSTYPAQVLMPSLALTFPNPLRSDDILVYKLKQAYQCSCKKDNSESENTFHRKKSYDITAESMDKTHQIAVVGTNKICNFKLKYQP